MYPSDDHDIREEHYAKRLQIKEGDLKKEGKMIWYRLLELASESRRSPISMSVSSGRDVEGLVKLDLCMALTGLIVLQ